MEASIQIYLTTDGDWMVNIMDRNTGVTVMNDGPFRTFHGAASHASSMIGGPSLVDEYGQVRI